MNENKPTLWCRIFGHKWTPAHVLRDVGWVYTDDVCVWCYMTEYRMPKGYKANPEAKP